MTPHCGACRHFEAGGAAIEAAFPGLSALSSGYASVRGGDGLCTWRDIYLPDDAGCQSFEPRPTIAAKSTKDHPTLG